MSSIGKIVNIECYFCADDLDRRHVEIVMEKELNRKSVEGLGKHFKRGFETGLKNNSTSLKEVDIITVHSEDLTATIQRYLDLGYLCDVRAFRNKGYMEPEYQVVILKKE
ncbi:hypothetical protein ACIQG2_001830 [Listeria monocytogenes]|nr:hypothetical protein [Listeria monocytogenes]HAA9963901.1 hypothetical protein [Listeria monocytogenes]HAM1305146.1 hypothetical protein [Listeria monocytogenes]HAM2072337.1 hypothetical protein [Listeria monocytogenes]